MFHLFLYLWDCIRTVLLWSLLIMTGVCFSQSIVWAMASLSEEVLLVVKKVRQRKQDGTLYLMAERIAWGPEGKDRFTVSHLYADIRCEYLVSSSSM